jgi:hypothetical protein
VAALIAAAEAQTREALDTNNRARERRERQTGEVIAYCFRMFVVCRCVLRKTISCVFVCLCVCMCVCVCVREPLDTNNRARERRERQTGVVLACSFIKLPSHRKANACHTCQILATLLLLFFNDTG